MAYAYPANVISVIVDPSGTPETMVCNLLHYEKSIGPRPSSVVISLLNKRPKDINNADYRGKTAQFKVDGVMKMTGTIQRISKEWSRQEVVFVILDKRHQIDNSYVGAQFLETLDTDGLPTSFTNGLAYYGADITFNLNGRPNRSKTENEFVPPGFEHNVSNALYWTYGQAFEYLWNRCVTAVAMPEIGGQTPADWTWGGWNKKMEELAVFSLTIGQAINQLMIRTRSQWWLDGTDQAVVASIDQPTTSLPLVIPDPDSPIVPDGTATDRPIDIQVEESTDDTVTQLDIIGGRQQREILFETKYSGTIYTGQTLISTDFEQQQWFAISNNAGWLSALDYPVTPFAADWSNYNVARYWKSYPQAGSPVREYLYRWNVKSSVWEAHKIGKNLSINDQPYRMLPTLLAARSKTGAYINPDEETAIEGVSPLELLSYQYPDGAMIDFDRGFILARGVEPLIVSPLYIIEPPYWGTSFPNQFTVAMECAYRAHKSVNVPITGVPSIRRCVVRNELIHKTRETTKMVAPVIASIDAANVVVVTDGISTPMGWTKDYSSPTTIPVKPPSFTYTTPAGIIVDGMAELNEIAELITPSVGLLNVTVQGAFPTWNDIELGTLISDVSGQYGLTGNEFVTAVVFDGLTQRTEFQATNRLGLDAVNIANAFVDQRSYRSNP